MRVSGIGFAVVAILFGSSVLSAQAFADHAAAIAGASAGVAGATAIKDPLTRILDAASGTTSNAAAAPAPQPVRKALRNSQAPPMSTPQAASSGASPSPSGSGHRSWRRRDRDRPVYEEGEEAFNGYREPPEPVFHATMAQLQSVNPGARQADLGGSLGTPAARITMDDNGHLVEILEYASSNGSRVGSVRCRDGHVESVTAAQ